jgi:hypothetical protein
MKRISATHCCALASVTIAILASSAEARADDEPSAPNATVRVRTDSSDVTVGYATGRAFAVGSGGAALAIGWKDVCIAPCEFQLSSGLHELVATGPGYLTGIGKFELKPGVNRFVVRTGSTAMRWGGWGLLLGGAVAATYGITYAAIPQSQGTPSWAIPAAIAGGVAAAGGIAMILMTSTTIAREGDSVAAASGRGGKFLGVGYANRF